METSGQDSGGEWALPEEARPPTLKELEARIDEALASARASEAAVMTVGAAALDAAEQARRAAELAELASAAMLSAPQPAAQAVVQDEGLRDFSARADRVVARLRRLELGSLTRVG